MVFIVYWLEDLFLHLSLPEHGGVVDGLGHFAGERHLDQEGEDASHLTEVVAVLENLIILLRWLFLSVMMVEA